MPLVAPRNLFAKIETPLTAGEIIAWWEARRLHYNVIILAWAMVLGLIAQVRKSGLRFEKDDLVVIGLYLLFFQLPANVWYTGGWIVDLILKKLLRVTWRGFGGWALGFGIFVSLLFYFVIFINALKS